MAFIPHSGPYLQLHFELSWAADVLLDTLTLGCIHENIYSGLSFLDPLHKVLMIFHQDLEILQLLLQRALPVANPKDSEDTKQKI